MTDAIEAMRWAFSQLQKGNAFVPQRTHLNIPDKIASALVMPAYVLESPYYSVKLVSINYSNPHKGLPLIHSIVQVFDASNGNLIITLDGNSITALRTGAASGLATEYLSKMDASTCAIFGTGVQAKSHIDAILSVRDIKKVIVYGRTKESVVDFIDKHQVNCQIDIGEESALESADIICTTTTSQHPLFNHNQLNSGCHINAIGSHTPEAREVSTDIIGASKVVVDSQDACQMEAGDLLIPIEKGKWSFEQLYGELGQLVNSEIVGRESDTEITLFKSVGVAIQDLAMAKIIMEKL